MPERHTPRERIVGKGPPLIQVAVIGAGYVGLVTAAGLAALDHDVGVGEADPDRLALLTDGRAPFHEPGLEELLAQGIASGSLSFYASNADAVDSARVVIIAVPTPPRPDGLADPSIVEGVVEEIAPVLKPDSVVALKSTVPVMTTKRIQTQLTTLGSSAVVVSNPEFLREGCAVSDFLEPSRIVIGTEQEHVAALMMQLYEGLDAPFVVTDPTSAELIKYASNAYLATRVSFANEIANVCQVMGADVAAVLQGIGHDPRIGHAYLRPGPGFGGSCLPKDTRALVATASDSGEPLRLLEAALSVNRNQRDRILNAIRAAAGGTLRDRAVAFWGLSFKAGSDDVRESPAVALAQAVIEEGGLPVAYDPLATRVSDQIRRVDEPIEAVKGADVLVVATAWDDFRSVDLADVAEAMRGSAVVDACYVLDGDEVRRAGLAVYDGTTATPRRRSTASTSP